MFKEPNSKKTPSTKKSSSGSNTSSSNSNKSSSFLNSSDGSNSAATTVAVAGNTTSTTATKHNLDDINLLLYMEMRIRAKEDELNIKRQLDIAYKKYCENFRQYVELYSKYVNLLKMAALRNVLQKDEGWFTLLSQEQLKPQQLQQLQLDEAKSSLEKINVKLNCDKIMGYIDENVLKQFHELLPNVSSLENIEKRRLLLEELKVKYEQLQSSVRTISVALRKSTSHGIDYFVECLNDVSPANVA